LHHPDILFSLRLWVLRCFFQIFSTPEVHIGFHPDAGASFYLSHLPGHVGMQYSLVCCFTVIDSVSLRANILYKIMFLYTRSDMGVFPNIVGEFLALTGERINGADMIAVGLATHFAVSEVSQPSTPPHPTEQEIGTEKDWK
jgi:3-hydroxyisobutyryl-CoA hydrolase